MFCTDDPALFAFHGRHPLLSWQYWAPLLFAMEPLGDNWGIPTDLQVPVPGRNGLGDDSAHRLVGLICSSRVIAVNSAFLCVKVNGRVHLFRTGRAVVARKRV